MKIIAPPLVIRQIPNIPEEPEPLVLFKFIIIIIRKKSKSSF
jgi:hypothetical protein